MSKRLVDLSEAFDIIDWNISLLSFEQFVRIPGSPLMISSNLGIREGVAMHRINPLGMEWGAGSAEGMVHSHMALECSSSSGFFGLSGFHR